MIKKTLTSVFVVLSISGVAFAEGNHEKDKNRHKQSDAATACVGKDQGQSCSYQSNATKISGTCQQLSASNQKLVCKAS